MKKSLLLVLSGLFVFASSLHAQQGLSTMGTDFYVPMIQSSDACPQLEALRSRKLLVTAFSDTRFSIYYFDRKTGAEQFAGTYTATATQGASVTLDVAAMHSQAAIGEVPEWTSCHLVAEHPVSVHAFSFGPVECYESMLLPTNLLGNSYIVSSTIAGGPHKSKLCEPDTASSVLVVVATEDNTHVAITPSDYTLSNQHDPDRQFSVVLQRGQVYTVKSRKTTGSTLDHSSVSADKPIVVWGGAEAVAGEPSGITDPDEDLRNIVAQQMLPVRLWSRGPFYMAPLIDPPGLPIADPAAGNAMLYYGADTGTRWTHTDLLLNFNTWPLAPSGSAAVENIIGATLDSASKPIMLELFDYRAENLNYPVATPTLMNVLPWITAVHSATFVSPAVPKSAEGSSYVTLIVKTYPDYPQLRYYVDGADSGALYGRIAEYRLGSYMSGWTYRLPAGHTYRIVSDSAFIAYQSNFFGVALNGHVRHGDPGSYFFSCATPVVGRYPSSGSEHPNATVSYNCDASWTIAASGSTTAPLGLATVLRDAHGDYMRLAQDSGFASSNIAGSGPLLTPNSLTARFRVAVLDPLRNADAWIEVQNTLGNDTILHLHYTAPPLSQSVESISFDGAPVGLDSCVRITYRNTGTRGQDTVHMTRIVHTDSTFIVQTSAPLPLALAASDSVIVTVCHTGHVESRLDTLHVQLLCGEARVPIRSISAKTMMTANDYDFHGVVVGSTENKRIALMNTGPANLLLASVKRTGSTAFVFTDSSRLPHMLEPGASIELGFRYHPTSRGADTAYFTWISNAEGTKTISRVIGSGLLGAVEWRDSILTFHSTRATGDTALLVNATGKEFAGPVVIENVSIAGPDASDFAIVSNELGYTPIVSFPVAPEESVWFYIRFQPDTLRGTRDRHAQLIALDLAGNTPTAQLLGQIGTADVREQNGIGFVVTQNSRSLHVTLPNDRWRLEVFDALGRSVLPVQSATEDATIDIATLATGTYILRAATATDQKVISRAFQIRR